MTPLTPRGKLIWTLVALKIMAGGIIALLLLGAMGCRDSLGLAPPAECSKKNAVWQPLKVPTDSGTILVYTLRCDR